MEIKIDDKTLNEYVEKAVNNKIESLTDEIIEDKIYDALLGKVDGILTAYKNDIKYFVEKHVRDYIKGIIEVLMPEMVKRNPIKDHGNGDEFTNSIEEMIERTDNVMEAGLLAMMMAIK